MAYGPGPTQWLDAQGRQDWLNRDDFGLIGEIRRGSQLDKEIGKMNWNWAAIIYSQVIEARFLGANSSLVAEVNEMMIAKARTSIDNEEWRAYERPMTDEELRRQYYLDVGKVFTVSFETRPEAWLQANFLLLHDAWWKTGAIDRDKLVRVFSHPMEGVPVLEGVWSASDLLSLSAWSQIREVQTCLDPSGRRRRKEAADTIGLMLAEDPGQLHDRKSPARVRARGFMRRNMEEWVARGNSATALNWLRAFEWREGKSDLTPEEVLFRAYAYMPSVEPPSNIRARVESLAKIQN